MKIEEFEKQMRITLDEYVEETGNLSWCIVSCDPDFVSDFGCSKDGCLVIDGFSISTVRIADITEISYQYDPDERLNCFIRFEFGKTEFLNYIYDEFSSENLLLYTRIERNGNIISKVQTVTETIAYFEENPRGSSYNNNMAGTGNGDGTVMPNTSINSADSKNTQKKNTNEIDEDLRKALMESFENPIYEWIASNAASKRDRFLFENDLEQLLTEQKEGSIKNTHPIYDHIKDFIDSKIAIFEQFPEFRDDVYDSLIASANQHAVGSFVDAMASGEITPEELHG